MSIIYVVALFYPRKKTDSKNNEKLLKIICYNTTMKGGCCIANKHHQCNRCNRLHRKPSDGQAGFGNSSKCYSLL